MKFWIKERELYSSGHENASKMSKPLVLTTQTSSNYLRKRLGEVVMSVRNGVCRKPEGLGWPLMRMSSLEKSGTIERLKIWIASIT